MKRNLLALLATVLTVAGLSAAPANATTTTGASDGFTYSEDGAVVTITGCDGTCPAELQIPATLSATGSKPVTAIGYQAFHNTSIHTVTLPNGLITIGQEAFAGDFALTSVLAPASLETIEPAAFYSDHTLSNFSIIGQSHLTTVEHSVFQSTAFQSFTFPATTTFIGDCVFASVNTLSSIQVADGNPAYKSENGILLTADGTGLIAVPNGFENPYIPSSVTTVHDCAFYGNESITSVEFSTLVTSIGQVAFAGNTLLTNVTFYGPLPTGGTIVLSSLPNSSNVYYYPHKSGWAATVSNPSYGNLHFVPMQENFYIRPAAITGTAKVGKRISIYTGGWTTYGPSSVTYRFYACTKPGTAIIGMKKLPKGCVAIKKATKRTLKLTKSQKGKYVRALVTVTAMNGTANILIAGTARVK